MKTKEEIEQLAFLKYQRVINDNPLCRNPNDPMEDDNTYERKIWIGAYTQCQEDTKQILLDFIKWSNAVDEYGNKLDKIDVDNFLNKQD